MRPHSQVENIRSSLHTRRTVYTLSKHPSLPVKSAKTEKPLQLPWTLTSRNTYKHTTRTRHLIFYSFPKAQTWRRDLNTKILKKKVIFIIFFVLKVYSLLIQTDNHTFPNFYFVVWLYDPRLTPLLMAAKKIQYILFEKNGENLTQALKASIRHVLGSVWPKNCFQCKCLLV